MYRRNSETHHTIGSPWSRIIRSDKSLGMAGGKNFGLGFTESMIGISTTGALGLGQKAWFPGGMAAQFSLRGWNTSSNPFLLYRQPWLLRTWIELK
jgi:hypothetical protein